MTAGHADGVDGAAGRDDVEGLLERGRRADAVDDVVGAAGEPVVDHPGPDRRSDVAAQLVGIAGDVGAELLGEALLVGVLGGGEEGAAEVAETADGGDREQTEGAGADDRRLAGVDATGGVHRARGRLDQHGLLVGQVVGDGDELGLVGDEQGRPPAAGRLAEPGLQARFEVPEGDALAEVRAVGRAHVAHRLDAPHDAGEDGDEHDSPAVVGVAHDLVAGHERERDDGLEVAGGVAVDRRQVGAADPGEAGAHAHPTRTGELGRVDVGQPQRADPRAAPGRQPAGDGRGRVPRHLPLEQQRLHRSAPEP